MNMFYVFVFVFVIVFNNFCLDPQWTYGIDYYIEHILPAHFLERQQQGHNAVGMRDGCGTVTVRATARATHAADALAVRPTLPQIEYLLRGRWLGGKVGYVAIGAQLLGQQPPVALIGSRRIEGGAYQALRGMRQLHKVQHAALVHIVALPIDRDGCIRCRGQLLCRAAQLLLAGHAEAVIVGLLVPLAKVHA